MFKLKNADAIKFNSPVVRSLLNDNNRVFPVKDALRLTTIINQIIENLKPFKKAYHKIVIDNGGKINDSTYEVSFPDAETAKKADKDLKDIASIEVEYHGDLLKPSEGWPSLTIPEANIIACICDS